MSLLQKMSAVQNTLRRKIAEVDWYWDCKVISNARSRPLHGKLGHKWCNYITLVRHHWNLVNFVTYFVVKRNVFITRAQARNESHLGPILIQHYISLHRSLYSTLATNRYDSYGTVWLLIACMPPIGLAYNQQTSAACADLRRYNFHSW